MKTKLLFWALVTFSLVLPSAFGVIQYDMMCNDGNETMDTHVREAEPNTNKNADVTSVFNGTNNMWVGLYMFYLNISRFPNDASYTTIVKEAYLNLGLHSGGGVTTYAHGIQGNENGGTFDDAETTWNTNFPCNGKNFVAAASHCNETPEGSANVAAGNYTFNVTKHAQIAIDSQWGNASYAVTTAATAASINFYSIDWAGAEKQSPCFNITYEILNKSDTTPPEINANSYNMTSEGGEGCINWRTDKNNGCTTTDTTPTVFITTNENANCAIGTSNRNYTSLGGSRVCSGAGTTVHTCTLIAQDELTQENSFVYIGCKDGTGNENRTSTSGALRISIQSSDLEAIGRNAIESGIQHALGSGYTIYTDQKLYARNSANSQFVATFDKVIKWLNKIWAFNILTGNQTASSAFNITPVLYVLDMTNSTNSTVNSTVYQLIINTK